jgi:glucoamylase
VLRNIHAPFIKISDASGAITPAPGSVIASPNVKDPDYFFHWVRDSALVMKTIVSLYEKEKYRNPLKSLQHLKTFDDFISLTEKLQSSDSPYGLGDPRFNADGTVDKIKWARPQLDGPV